MALITGPDYLLPPYILAEDRQLPEEQRTKWFQRQLGTSAAVRAKQLLQAMYAGKLIDWKQLDDAVRAGLEGWENLRWGKEDVLYLDEECKRDLLGDKRERVVSADLLGRLPITWKIELVGNSISPTITSDDVGN
jgi:hypothetical protein